MGRVQVRREGAGMPAVVLRGLREGLKWIEQRVWGEKEGREGQVATRVEKGCRGQERVEW